MKSSISHVEDVYSSVFPDYKICKLFIGAGFSTSAKNFMLETPLHIVSAHQNFNLDIVKLLLKHGAHIDQRDLTGNLPCRRLEAISHCQINPLNFITLKCLASRKIVKFSIPFSQKVPTHLEEFILMH